MKTNTLEERLAVIRAEDNGLLIELRGYGSAYFSRKPQEDNKLWDFANTEYRIATAGIKAPVDLVIEVTDSDQWIKRHFSRNINKKIECLSNGASSLTVNNDVVTVLWEKARYTISQWMPWRGGDCPLEKGCFVEAALYSGSNIKEYAGQLNWSHRDRRDDIVAFRTMPHENIARKR